MNFRPEFWPNRFTCPTGHLMHPYEKFHNGSKRYRIIGKHCGLCPLKESCLPKNYNKRSRFMFRSPYQDEIDKVKKRQKTAHFKKKLYERQWRIEALLQKQNKIMVFVVQNPEGFKSFKFNLFLISKKVFS